MDIPLSQPDISQAEIDAVVAVMKTPHLSLGPKLAEFEAAFAAQVGTRHAIAVSSGTAGLHLIMRAIGVGAGDEVITTPFSFIASSNSIMFDGGKPVFVDIDAETWNLDPERIEAAISDRTKGILAVDVFGQPARYDRINPLAERRGLTVIEDSCEALGARLNGRAAGSLGKAGVFGFYPNKQITTGEGGMIVTDDDEICQLALSMRNQGRDSHGGWLAHSQLGFNYRLSDIHCAIGIVQLERLEILLGNRARVAQMYRQRLAGETRIRMQRIDEDVEMSWFVFVVRLNDEYSQDDRDRILTQLREKGIGCSNYFTPIHLQPFYVDQFGFREGDFPICEALASRTIALPFHGTLSEAQIDRICAEFTSLL
jgi:perosamine synthetase